MLRPWLPPALFPSPRTDEEEIQASLSAAALEVAAVELEQQVHLLFEKLGTSPNDVAAIFDQAETDVLLQNPRAGAFEIRYARAARVLDVLIVALRARWVRG